MLCVCCVCVVCVGGVCCVCIGGVWVCMRLTVVVDSSFPPGHGGLDFPKGVPISAETAKVNHPAAVLAMFIVFTI